MNIDIDNVFIINLTDDSASVRLRLRLLYSHFFFGLLVLEVSPLKFLLAGLLW